MATKKNKTKTQKEKITKKLATNRKAKRGALRAAVVEVDVDETEANDAIETNTPADDDGTADVDSTKSSPDDDTGCNEGRFATPLTGKAQLPPVGTVVEKVDRHGNLRCRCVVEEDGIRYNRKLYNSVSAAAMAAAKDLGLKHKAQNGYTFWGITKPRRPAADRKEAVARAWERYTNHMSTWLKEAGTREARAPIAAALKQHTQKLDGFHKRVS